MGREMTFEKRVVLLSLTAALLLLLYLLGSGHLGRGSDPDTPGAGGAVIPREVMMGLAELRMHPGGGDSGDESSGAGSSEEPVVLRRDERHGWSIELEDGSYPAAVDRVEELLKRLSQLTVERIAATGAERHADFGVDRGSARRLQLVYGDGQGPWELLIGREASVGRGMYVRPAEEKAVYAVEPNLRFPLSRGADYYSDLRPLPRAVTGEAVIRISVDGDVRVDDHKRIVDRFTVVRARESGDETARRGQSARSAGYGAWRFAEEPGEAAESIDDRKVARWTRQIGALEAASFVTENIDDAELPRPVATLTFETATAREYRIEIYRRKGDSGKVSAAQGFQMRVHGPGVPRNARGESYLYSVPPETVGQVFRNRDDLL
ncbi:MAG: DUF4340 domain-containing protein [Spirochaetaceae bacterium]